MGLRTRTKVLALALVLSAGTIFGNSAHAETETTAGWQYLWTIYGWFPSIDGTLLHELPPADGDSIAVDVGDIIDKLDMAFMTAFESFIGPAVGVGFRF